MVAPKVHVPDVCERDVDFLLMEEFFTSPEFCTWFLGLVGRSGVSELVDARRSVRTSTGESDLELTFVCGVGNLRVLIENKVDACFQPRQPERYTQRASNYLATQSCSEVMTVIVAPEIYFGDEVEDYGFSAAVTYEQLLSWFEREGSLSLRAQYKLCLLRTAIERGRDGYHRVPDEKVTEFWNQYWQVAMEVAPRLAMRQSASGRPANSRWVYFYPPELPAGSRLVHKMNRGCVDLQLSGRADGLAQLAAKYRGKLPPGIRLERASNSAAFRVSVTPMDPATTDFAEAEPTIRQSLGLACDLLDWYVSTGTDEQE